MPVMERAMFGDHAGNGEAMLEGAVSIYYSDGEGHVRGPYR